MARCWQFKDNRVTPAHRHMRYLFVVRYGKDISFAMTHSQHEYRAVLRRTNRPYSIVLVCQCTDALALRVALKKRFVPKGQHRRFTAYNTSVAQFMAYYVMLISASKTWHRHY